MQVQIRIQVQTQDMCDPDVSSLPADGPSYGMRAYEKNIAHTYYPKDRPSVLDQLLLQTLVGIMSDSAWVDPARASNVYYEAHCIQSPRLDGTLQKDQ